MENFEQLVKRYNDIKYKIRRLVLQQQELRELGCLPRVGEMDGMPRALGYNGSPIEKYLIRLDDLEHEQMDLEKTLEEVRKKITAYIDNIPNYTTREIFELKIFTGKGWRFISRQVNYSVSRIRQFYDEGLTYIRAAKIVPPTPDTEGDCL